MPNNKLDEIVHQVYEMGVYDADPEAYSAMPDNCKGERMGISEAKQAINDYIKEKQAEARINELVTLDNENIPALNDSKMFHAYFLKRISELSKEQGQG